MDLQEIREAARLSHRTLGKCWSVVLCRSGVLGLEILLQGSQQENSAPEYHRQAIPLLSRNTTEAGYIATIEVVGGLSASGRKRQDTICARAETQ